MRTVPNDRSNPHAEGPYRGLSHFSHATHGAAMLEYALLLALLVSSGVGAYVIVVAGADRVFQVAAQRMASPTESERLPRAERVSARTSTIAVCPPSGWRAGKPTITAIAFGVVWVAIAAAGLSLWRLCGLWRSSGRAALSHGEPVVTWIPPGAEEQLFEKRQQIRRLFSRDPQGLRHGACQVRDLMSTRLTTIAPGKPSADAATMMNDCQIRHVLVCRKNRGLLGIISDRDIKERVGATAGDIMTRDPFTVAPETPVGQAITCMLVKRISCLPVLSEEGKLCGVLTTTDLMLSLQCTLHILEAVPSGMSLPTHSPQPANFGSTEQSPTILTDSATSHSCVSTP